MPEQIAIGVEDSVFCAGRLILHVLFFACLGAAQATPWVALIRLRIRFVRGIRKVRFGPLPASTLSVA